MMRTWMLVGLLAACGGGRAGTGSSASASSLLDHADVDQSDLVTHPDGSCSCVPRDLAADDWYGCWVRTDSNEPDQLYCVPPPERRRVEEDGGVVLQMQPTCAASQIWDVRVEGESVPTNTIVWGAELRIPPGLIGAVAVDSPAAVGVAATWRFRDDVGLEEPECGHEPRVDHNSEGDRHVLCRHEWRTFTAAAGEGSGLLAGALEVFALAAEPGGGVSLDFGFAGCGMGETSLLDADTTEALAATCCVAVHPERLEWSVGESGQLSDGPYFGAGWGGSGCCEPAAVVGEEGDCSDDTLRQYEAGPQKN